MDRTLVVALLLVVSLGTSAQELHLYKKVDSVQLYLEVFEPGADIRTDSMPAMVFFFGGGWRGGDRSQFAHHARFFSKRGIVCFLADYRIANKHNTTPFESLEDAKSAIRFIRKNAAQFGVDPNKVIASGGSAGGHLAAASAMIDGFDSSEDDLSISSSPDALVLFNPVIDNGPAGYGFDRIGERYRDFSPLHNIRAGTPPTILFLGTNDALIPVSTAKYYQTAMHRVGSRCDLKLYKDQGHGFFNYKNFENYHATVDETDIFLQSLDFIKAEPRVKIE